MRAPPSAPAHASFRQLNYATPGSHSFSLQQSIPSMSHRSHFTFLYNTFMRYFHVLLLCAPSSSFSTQCDAEVTLLCYPLVIRVILRGGSGEMHKNITLATCGGSLCTCLITFQIIFEIGGQRGLFSMLRNIQ